MKTLRHLFFYAGLFASLAVASGVHSAGARSSASATIIAPVNVSKSAAAAYTQVLFSSSTGILNIRISSENETGDIVLSTCGWFMNGVGNNRCNARTTLQVSNDGTLNGQQGVSLSVTRESHTNGVVMAMLAYN